MSWSQSDLDKLNRAIGQGVTSVAFRDRTVTYRSIDEMLRVRSLMEAELTPASVKTERVQRVSTAKGYQ
jgi:hypothetical protein